ncbi:MAG: efflux RND transporter permease subunit, partial [Arenicellales bacterium]
MSWFSRHYNHWTVLRPWPLLIALLLVLMVLGWHARDFRLDASADSLLLENDQDYKVFRELSERYQSKSFLVVALVPEQGVFAASTLKRVDQLALDLEEVPGISSVVSLLDVPLLAQGEGSLTELAGNYRTLRDSEVDLDKARDELTTSPVFSELIVSADGRTTALQLNLDEAPEFEALQGERRRMSQRIGAGKATSDEKQRFVQLDAQYELQKRQLNQKRHDTIVAVREVMERHHDAGSLVLGGVSMIADDMITFIRNDLVTFGLGVFVFLVAMLAIVFRAIRWVVLPLASCFFAGLSMMGLLGLAGWQVTVISSNFISLMLILTMSMNVHLVVRHRQLVRDHPDMAHPDRVLMTMQKMFWPCLYTALTTILAFGSLVLSSIKPVIDFGWMMSLGLVVTFAVSFLLFPSLLAVLGPAQKGESASVPGLKFTATLSRITAQRGRLVITTSLALAILGGIGITRLEVENSFINYFGKDTEIYRGLKLIDRELGGTTPLDVIVRFEPEPEIAATDESDDDLALLLGSVSQGDPVDYWFTPRKIKTVSMVHDFLESRYGVGQVLSLASLIRVGESISKAPFDTFELAVLYKRMPDDLKAALLSPYVSIERDEVRLTARIRDSLPDLRRNVLLQEIQSGLEKELNLEPEAFQISGLVVLYNNMLQSLFSSQIMSLGVVMLGIALMLLILFRSLRLAVIGIAPNLLAAAIILGVMGWARIPLDMMTITIASITLGIAVDNSIHYIYRFRSEIGRVGDYVETLHYCHANIGRAIFYTAITIIAGFSILVLSNFLPTIYFGVFTALGMAMALLASLTLLPRLILWLRPFG